MYHLTEMLIKQLRADAKLWEDAGETGPLALAHIAELRGYADRLANGDSVEDMARAHTTIKLYLLAIVCSDRPDYRQYYHDAAEVLRRVAPIEMPN